MTVAITCASCRRTLRVPENQVGQLVQCPLCIETFLAEADPHQPPPPVERPPQRKPVAAELAADRGGDAVVVVLEESAEEAAELAPSASTRPTKPFKPVPFSILITHDPDRLFRGRAESDISLDGLRVRVRRRDLWVTVCGPHQARYLGLNRIAVFLDGREVTLTLVKERTDLNRLARDVVDFLNGRRAELKARDYLLPWKITLLPWLAVVVPFLAMWLRVLGGVHGGGRFLWFVVAGLAVLLGYKLLRRETLSTQRRVAVAGTVVGCCFLLLAGAFAYRLAYPTTVPAAAWKPFAPPGQRARVRILMPGDPQKSRNANGAGSNTPVVVYTVNVYALDKTFSLGISAVTRAQFQKDRDLLEAQKIQLEQNLIGYESGKSERVVLKSGEVGAQLVMKLTGARGDYSNRGKTQISRLFLIGDQLFTLSVIGDDVDSDDPDALKFFGSFEIGKGSPPPSPNDLPGVVLYLSFEDLDSQVRDRIVGTISYHSLVQTEGVRGKAASFIKRGYVLFERHPNLDFGVNQPFSCVGWLKTLAENQPECLLCMRGRDERRFPALLEINQVDGNLVAVIQPDGDDFRGNVDQVRGPSVNDGDWHHFALTRSDDGTIALYVDGKVADSKRNAATAGALTTTTRSLGRNQQWDDRGWSGALDEVAFFNRCLRAEEIAKLARAESP